MTTQEPTMKTNTPETDAQEGLFLNWVPIEFARSLEREKNKWARVAYVAWLGWLLIFAASFAGCSTRETPDERRWREIREAGEKTTYGGETYEFNGRAWRKVK